MGSVDRTRQYTACNPSIVEVILDGNGRMVIVFKHPHEIIRVPLEKGHEWLSSMTGRE